MSVIVLKSYQKNHQQREEWSLVLEKITPLRLEIASKMIKILFKLLDCIFGNPGF